MAATKSGIGFQPVDNCIEQSQAGSLCHLVGANL